MKNTNSCKSGFTLIELLVVVLIIGILAAIALPQYQKAVEKSKAAQALALLKPIAQAARTYYLTNGTYARDIDTLDVGLSDAQKEEFLCNHIVSGCSNKEWGISLYKNVDNMFGVVVMRTSGKYEGGGFFIFQDVATATNIQPDTLYCYERLGTGNIISARGAYCPKLFAGTRIGPSSNGYLYKLP